MKKSNLTVLLMIAAATAFAEPQTTCPVMKKNKINQKLYVDVNGYRIYVCCGGCKKRIGSISGTCLGFQPVISKVA